MLIRALKTTTGFPRGSIADFEDYTARELIAAGYAIEVLPLAQQEAANDNRPLSIGGQTGADGPPSSSPEGQAPVTLTLVSRVDEQKSLQSTTDTDSSVSEQDKTQTPSTPATSNGGNRKRGRPRSRG